MRFRDFFPRISPNSPFLILAVFFGNRTSPDAFRDRTAPDENPFLERNDSDERTTHDGAARLLYGRTVFLTRGFRSILALNILVPSYLFGAIAEVLRGRPDIGGFLLVVPVLLGVAGWFSLRIAGEKGKPVALRVISQSEHTDMAVAYIVIYLFPAVHPHPWMALLLLTLASLIIEIGADPFPANPMFKVFGRRLATVDMEEGDGVRRRIVLIVPKGDRTIPAHVRAVSLGGGVFLLPPGPEKAKFRGGLRAVGRASAVRERTVPEERSPESVTDVTRRRDGDH